MLKLPQIVNRLVTLVHILEIFDVEYGRNSMADMIQLSIRWQVVLWAFQDILVAKLALHWRGSIELGA